MVLRDGESAGTIIKAELRRDSLIEMMVGRRLDQEFPPRRPFLPSPSGSGAGSEGAPCLTVKNLCRGNKVRDVSFTLHHGEIVALTGLVGAGRTEVARLLFGADRPGAGTIALHGRTLLLRGPRDAIRAGICLLTEDRKNQGLILNQSVRANFGLPNLGRFSFLGILRPAAGAAWPCRNLVQTLGIKIPSPESAAGQSVRRQSAESRPGEMAASEQPRRSLRRADARHRCRRQGRNLSGYQRISPRRARRS